MVFNATFNTISVISWRSVLSLTYVTLAEFSYGVSGPLVFLLLKTFNLFGFPVF
jgi:hypothetical protein